MNATALADRAWHRALAARGWERETTGLARLLAEQEKLEFIDLAKIDLDENAVDYLPESVARRVKAVAYGIHNSVLLVAVADPTDEDGLDEVRDAVGRRVRFKVAVPSEIELLYDAYGEPLVHSA